MKITVHTEQSEELKKFTEKEWDIANYEHYGARLDWKAYDYHFIAEENGQIVGAAFGIGVLSVFDLAQFIVAHTKHGQGIGRKLMEEVERLCKEKGYHKIILNTGKGWKAEEFYKKLGFHKVVDLKNHYHKKDFILYEKFI